MKEWHETKQCPDADLTSVAVFNNSYINTNPASAATGFRTNGLRHRSRSLTGQSRVAEDFLVGTRFLRIDREAEVSVQTYFRPEGLVMLSLAGAESSQVKELPKSVRLRREVGDVIGKRRSTRRFTGDPIELPHLSTLLRAASGVTRQSQIQVPGGQGEVTLRFRAVSSGGGLYPVTLYVATLRAQRLDRAVYRFDPIRDGLIRAGGSEHLTQVLDAFPTYDQASWTSHSSAIFLFIGHPWRSMRKYGNRGLRFLFLEAGAMAQNIHLACEALGLGSFDCASVYDDEVHEALGIDGIHESLLHTVIIGAGAE
jgi:SagB-type dehydrogenase family enzyme